MCASMSTHVHGGVCMYVCHTWSSVWMHVFCVWAHAYGMAAGCFSVSEYPHVYVVWLR